MRCLTLAAAPVLTLLLAACQAPRPHDAVHRPPGFTIAASVHPPQHEPPDQPPRALRPVRYVVETDALLRIATGPMLARPGSEHPPLVRRLSPWQMDELWRRAAAAGLFDPDHPGRFFGPPPAPRHAQSPTAVFEVTSAFRPSTIVVVLDGASPQSTAAIALLDHIAELSWIE